MRTTKLLSLLALVVFLACNMRAFAAAPDRKATADGVQTLYIYGVSQNLNDTIAYVSDITVITGSHLLEKGYFLQRAHSSGTFFGCCASRCRRIGSPSLERNRLVRGG